MLLGELALWSVMPAISAACGFALMCSMVHVLKERFGYKARELVYLKEKARPQCFVHVGFDGEAKAVWRILLGPTTGLSAFVLALAVCFTGAPRELPSFATAVWQYILLVIIGDLGLYIGHRLEHEIPYLWTHVHAFHHTVHSPSPFATLYLHPIDAALQGPIPFTLGALIVRPHLAVFCFYVFCRVAENAMNHSGMDCRFLDVLWLKVLPLRCSVAHHDHHHRWSNRMSASKNLGEQFWVWDWMFGTLATPLGRPLCDVKGA